MFRRIVACSRQFAWSCMHSFAHTYLRTAPVAAASEPHRRHARDAGPLHILLVAAVILTAGVVGAPGRAQEIWPTPGGWASAPPEAVGMDPARTAAAIAYGRDRGGSGILVRAGQRVGGWGDPAARYILRSTTKSFGAVLLGLAFQDGRLGLDTPVQTWLPELGVPQATAEATAWLSQITVRQLANHTAGFAKPGGFEPLLFPPGTAWFYSDGGANWLADLLTVSYMTDLQTLLRSRVLAPMGIGDEQLVWRRNAYRTPTLRGVERREFASGISTSVDVMARFGLMLLRDGRWQFAQILPPTFPDQAGRPGDGLGNLPCLDPDPKKCPGATNQYGILFWTNGDGHVPDLPLDAYWAAGQGTSFILVVPSLDLVAARAGPTWPGPSDANLMNPFFSLVSQAANP